MKSSKPLVFALILLGSAANLPAKIGVEYQMPLGNPSAAQPDANNHEHFLVQRSVFAMDYDDREGEPNWVSWDLTAADMGPAKRSPSFHTDSGLPASFRHITSANYKQSGFDRGHMCPSADRTDNALDNDAVFTMANIVPQTPDNNQGVWERLEADCRDMARAGYELLITCGPASFGERQLANGPVLVPSHLWKIVVAVPEGAGSVLSRITAQTRVIAVDIPNVQGIRNDPWSRYVVSVNQIEALTGLRFFSALRPELAAVLKAKLDGQVAPMASVAEVAAPARRAESDRTALWIPIAGGLLAVVLVVGILGVIFFIKTRPKPRG